MLRISKRWRSLVGLITAAIIGALSCLAFNFNLLYGMQQQSSDFLFQAANIYHKAEPEEKIVIVGIDDKSLEEFGHFSRWPRSYYAQLVDTLAEAKARVVVFDILFSEPSPGDDELATSIGNAGNVILPVILAPKVSDSTMMRHTTQSKDFLKPLEIFKEGATALGHANVFPDTDGVVRRLSVVLHNGDEYEPALALTAVSKYLRRPEVLESSIKDNVLPFAGRFVPITGGNEMLINYLGSPQGAGGILSFQTVSFVDVINGDADLTLFQDKIVVIGSTASGLGDTFWTPAGVMMNGVEIHASAIHTILTGNFVKPVSSAVTVMSILLLALLCGLLVLHLRALWATLSVVFLIIAYFLTAFSLFDNGILPNMLYPPLSIAVTFAGVNLYNVASERSEKREMTETFGRYISPSVVDKILSTLGKGKPELGGAEQEVTVAFADIRGFTSIAETMPPEELVRALNTYLSVVIRAILKFDGMINKFGGDSVMAVWNVPIMCEGHALLAIKAAAGAQRAVRELQEKETSLAKMEFGIGINTGTAVAGNMGAEDRLEYSVIGDAVNTAARLASVTPGGKVWIGANTFTQVKDYVQAKPLERLSIKGKREKIQAYEVVDIQF